MAYSVKKGFAKTSVPIGLGLGIGVGWAVSLVIAAVMTVAVDSERLSASSMSFAAVATLVIATFASARIGAEKMGIGRIPACLAAGGGYFMSLLCINVLFFGGKFQGLGAAALTVAGTAALAGLIGTPRRKKRYGIKARK